MSVHFDTLEFVKTLTASGVAQAHAEAIARARAKSMGDLAEHDLATKSDLKVLGAEIKANIDGLRADLRSEFQTELRSFKYAASIATAFLSLVVVITRFTN
jgi:hypothetical protein